MLSTDTVAQEIAEILGETEERPRTQIAAVVAVLGEQVAFELLAETQRVEQSGGMQLADSSRRRSRGGVFFVLARKRLGRKDRLAVFGWKEPQKGDHVAPKPGNGSGDSGENADDDRPSALPDLSIPAAPSPPAELVTKAADQEPAKTNPKNSCLTSPIDPTIPADLMTNTTDPKNPTDAHTNAELPTSTPRAAQPVAQDEMARAVARTTARKAVVQAIVSLEPIDQRLVLLDSLAELEQGQVGPRDDRSQDGRERVEAAPVIAPVEQTARADKKDEATPSVERPVASAPKASNGGGTGRNGTRRAAILDAIRAAPGVGLGELAVRFYEEDTATNRKGFSRSYRR